MSFEIKDSGARQHFASGMQRDVSDGKIGYHRIFDGVLVDRLAVHLTLGATKYPDCLDGSPNWLKADGEAELIRFRESAVRHFRQWLRGDADEDHFAAAIFNMNGYETVLSRHYAESNHT